jgi:PEP-CTERM motif
MLKGLLPVAAAAALYASTLPAFAVGVFEEFTVNEQVVPGTGLAADPALVSDKLNGFYQERLTVTGVNTFSAQAVASFTTFLENDGSAAVSSFLNGPGATGYKMYAVFTASGAITGPNAFQSTNNQFKLYLDPDKNTTNTLTDGLTAPVLGGSGEDILLASAGPALTFGTGNLTGPPGAFNIDWADFTLTNFGKTYFIAPNPFYMNVRVNGDYDIVTSVPIGQTVNITGDVSAVFIKVPEPTTLALAGLALVGLGVVSRRRKPA